MRFIWRFLLAVSGVVCSVLIALHWSGPRVPDGRIEIYQGVTLHAETIESAEGQGRLFVARVNLKAPGVELYVTPVDVSVAAKGWRYRLRRISEVLDDERLSVVINGPMFSSYSPFWVRMPGDLAKSAFGTLVADHVVGDVQPYSDVLWFDDQLEPHFRPWVPSLGARDLATAKWAIGGSTVLRNGRLPEIIERRRDSRTMAGIDRQGHLFLAVAEDISPRLLALKLAALGATEAIILDGGTSSAMAIGGGANGIGPGVVWGGWRPVATFFGIRAASLHGAETP